MKRIWFILAVAILCGVAIAYGNNRKQPLPFIMDDSGSRFYMSFHDKEEDRGTAATGFWESYFRSAFYGAEGLSLKDLNQGIFIPGSGYVVSDVEYDGTLLIVCHSGTHNKIPLQCEGFRRALEAKLWDNQTTAPTPEKEAEIYATILRKAKELLGDHLKVVQGNNPAIIFDVTAVAYLPHGQAVDKYRADSKGIINLAPGYHIAGDMDAWIQASESDQQYLLMAFCGWGPYTSATMDDWYSWSRYLVLLKPPISSTTTTPEASATADASGQHSSHYSMRLAI